MDDFEIDGELYEIDEIGDDEKYFFLTRLSDGMTKQEFDISDELYEEALRSQEPQLILVYDKGEFKFEDEE